VADWIEIASGALTAAINPLGAELSSLRDADGRELMTDADPAYWTGRAPILFPVVGRVHDDTILVDGKRYPIERHGFARLRTFALTERSDRSASFLLEADAESRNLYPFDFALRMTFTLDGATLTMTAEVTNPDRQRPLPMSFGWHPAFAWPLPYGGARADHRMVFATPEPGALKRITPEGYTTAPIKPSPVVGDTLILADSLFEDDALVWDPVQSRALRYGPPEGPWLDIDWDAPQLGIWTKPGARYVCVEPWHGFGDPEGFAGAFADKPGVFEVAPGGAWQCTMRVTLARP